MNFVTKLNIVIIVAMILLVAGCVETCRAQTRINPKIREPLVCLPINSPDPLERFVGKLTLEGHEKLDPLTQHAAILYHNARSIKVYLRHVEMAQGKQLSDEQIKSRLRALDLDAQKNPHLWGLEDIVEIDERGRVRRWRDPTMYPEYPQNWVQWNPVKVRFIFDSIKRQMPEDVETIKLEQRAFEMFTSNASRGWK